MLNETSHSFFVWSSSWASVVLPCCCHCRRRRRRRRRCTRITCIQPLFRCSLTLLASSFFSSLFLLFYFLFFKMFNQNEYRCRGEKEFPWTKGCRILDSGSISMVRIYTYNAFLRDLFAANPIFFKRIKKKMKKKNDVSHICLHASGSTVWSSETEWVRKVITSEDEAS